MWFSLGPYWLGELGRTETPISRPSCYTSENMMGIKKLHMEYTFFEAKDSTGQETALSLTADTMLSKLDKQDTKESNCWTLPRQGMIILQKFCFTDKSVRYSRFVGWNWMHQCFRGSVSDCIGSQMFLSFLSFESCLLCTSCLLG